MLEDVKSLGILQSCELVPRGGAKQAQKVKEEPSVKLHWPKTDQFINDSIFTLINSSRQLIPKEGFPFTLTSGTPQELCWPGRCRARQEGQELSEHQVSAQGLQMQQQSRLL